MFTLIARAAVATIIIESRSAPFLPSERCSHHHVINEQTVAQELQQNLTRNYNAVNKKSHETYTDVSNNSTLECNCIIGCLQRVSVSSKYNSILKRN